MQYRNLGRTDIKVSPYGLGAMMFGGIANAEHDDCTRIIHRALEAGINVVDTADRYSQGESEEIVGKALKGRRDKVVLATKVHGPMGQRHRHPGSMARARVPVKRRIASVHPCSRDGPAFIHPPLVWRR